MICPRCGNSVRDYEMCYGEDNEAVACMLCEDGNGPDLDLIKMIEGAL